MFASERRSDEIDIVIEEASNDTSAEVLANVPMEHFDRSYMHPEIWGGQHLMHYEMLV